MTEADQKLNRPEEGIEQSIELWKNSIVMFAVLLLGALIGYFWFYVKHLPPDPTATDRLGIGDWGAFGDFMGGLMNPIVAFAALYWLTQSVKLQKTELAKTQKALDEAAKAQAEQVENGRKNIQLAAATAIVNTLQMRIDGIQQQITKLQPPKVISVAGNATSEQINYLRKFSPLQHEMEALKTDRDMLIGQMHKMMLEAGSK